MTPDPRLVHQASINVMREILACIEEQAKEIARLREVLEQIVAADMHGFSPAEEKDTMVAMAQRGLTSVRDAG